MKPKPIVGQTLYALNVGNNASNREQTLTPVVVISVGRKYFKAIPEAYKSSPHMAVQYDLEDWRERTEYTPHWRLYESHQAWADERETHELDVAIGRRFGHHRSGLGLDALRKIAAIIAGATP